MDWIQGIQRAIDYMEENMTEEIDFDEVAQQAYASSFHFQRVFGIGVEYDGRKVDDDLEVVTIPAHTYVVFTSKGRMPEAFVETYHRIVTEFFPQSAQYEYAESVEFEVYASEDVSDPNYQCEIWIAVKEK